MSILSPQPSTTASGGQNKAVLQVPATKLPATEDLVWGFPDQRLHSCAHGWSSPAAVLATGSGSPHTDPHGMRPVPRRAKEVCVAQRVAAIHRLTKPHDVGDEIRPECGRCSRASAQCQYPVKRYLFREYGGGSSASAERQVEVLGAARPASIADPGQIMASARDVASAENRTRLLLHHYRRSVAPWVSQHLFHYARIGYSILMTVFLDCIQLDICDPSQTFGRLLLRFSARAPALLSSILNISSASASSSSVSSSTAASSSAEFSGVASSSSIPSLTLHHRPSKASSLNRLRDASRILSLTGRAALEAHASFALGKAQNIVESRPKDWTSGFAGNGPHPVISPLVLNDENEGANDDEFRMMWLAIWGLVVRLGSPPFPILQ
jgi:hypothetical protein